MKFREAISAAVAGNILEWYDFAVYSYLATTIARNFFPGTNNLASLLSVFAVFGVGFLVRPLGGFVIGRIGDVRGRKPALLVTLFSMAIATTGIGLLPNAEHAGNWAPALLVILRLVQGFSAGGQWPGSTTFVIEWAPHNRRGYYASLQQAAVAGGMLLGSGVAAVLSTMLGPDQMENWGWRIPFLLGGSVAPIGLYIRRNIGETPVFLEAKVAEQEEPGKRLLLLMASKAFGFTMLWTVSYYLMLTYLPTFTQEFAGLTQTQALWSNTIGLLVLVIVTPLMGHLSDRIGRKPLLLASCISFVILPYPLFIFMLAHAHLTTVIGIQVIFGLMIALFSGPGPAAIAEIFPTRSRLTWMAAGYTLSTTIFGGFAAYIAIALIGLTGSPVAPTYYLVAAAIISTLVIIFLRETSHEDLR